MKHEPYRVGLVGVGKSLRDNLKDGCRIGYVHAEKLQRCPRSTLVAGADIDPANLAAWQREFSVEKGYLSLEQMLAHEKLDVLAICTYVGLHRPMITTAVEAGVKAIVCEKPFLKSPGDLLWIGDFLSSTETKLVVNHMRRFQPVFRRARDLIRDGAIGSPLFMTAGIEGWDLAEWGAHWLDLFRFLNGDLPANWVMGQARVRGTRAFGHAMEEHAIAYLRFANGCLALVDGGHSTSGTDTMILVGSEGTIRIREERILLLERGGRQSDETFDAYTDAMWLAPYHTLYDWMEGGPEPDLAASNQVATSELYLGAYLSSLRRDRVDLPLQDSMMEWPLEHLAQPERTTLHNP